MTAQYRDSAVSRRSVLRGTAGLAGAAALAATAGPAAAQVARRRNGPPRNTVAVLGAGIGGLTAAHELAERGFEVTVFDRKELGGKSRTIPLPGTGSDGRAPLPGEHGARGFTSFYHHVHDTMRRIPLPGSRNTVHDNLIPFSVNDPRYPRANNLPDGFPLMFGFYFDPREALTPEGLQRILIEGFVKNNLIPLPEAIHMAGRVVTYLTSSEDRRFGQWEHVSWWDFVGAATRSPQFQALAATGLTRALVAAKEYVASTRTMGNMMEGFFLALLQELTGGPKVYEVLNGPTNEAWLDPWLTMLRDMGVQFQPGHALDGFEVAGDQIGGARIRKPDGSIQSYQADWYVCAVPTDRARGLWSPEIRSLDPGLARMDELTVDWMSGMQMFVTEKLELGAGYNIYLDAPWRLTSYSQRAFWDVDYAAKYGDGTINDGLTIDISDWDTPGILFGKTAKHCTREEIYQETWAQLAAALNDDGKIQLKDGIVKDWLLDPGISWQNGQNQSDEPLLINTIGSWAARPTAHTNIPNLFLAADYVQTNFDLATMEGANEAGRTAVNALLDAAGSPAARVQLFTRESIPAFEPLRQMDAARFRAGQPNLFDLG
ncbi:FAD-dependent oxidoreductase [Nocardia sp. NPDC050175]|uniref:hydroxysqualene dehydroxylase n=1 Tax=Nocardia sp. NPDC050175 TaxID=3364317 RepID=UPI003787B3C5